MNVFEVRGKCEEPLPLSRFTFPGKTEEPSNHIYSSPLQSKSQTCHGQNRRDRTQPLLSYIMWPSNVILWRKELRAYPHLVFKKKNNLFPPSMHWHLIKPKSHCAY